MSTQRPPLSFSARIMRIARSETNIYTSIAYDHTISYDTSYRYYGSSINSTNRVYIILYQVLYLSDDMM